MNFDRQFSADTARSPRTVVGWIVVASYAYYHLDVSLLSDTLFDQACKWLLDNYDDVEHRLKYLVDRDSLAAGSLYNVPMTSYPGGVRYLAEQYRDRLC